MAKPLIAARAQQHFRKLRELELAMPQKLARIDSARTVADDSNQLAQRTMGKETHR